MGAMLMAGTADELLSVQDVAKMLKVSRPKVYDLMRKGRLTPVEEDNPFLEKQRRRFRRGDVERLLREGRSPTERADSHEEENKEDA